jgi:PAS domain S-box-containing protein
MPESELQALLSILQIDLNQDIDLILKEILAIVAQEIGGTAGTIMLVTEETGELEMGAALGLGDDYIERVYRIGVPITYSPSRVVLKTGTYYEVPNIFDEPQDKWWADLGRDFGFSAQLFMPMKRKDEVIGLLNVYMPEPHHYTHDEITFVSIAASHAVTIIEKAQLYQHVLEKRKELENEIKARQLVEETLEEKERLLDKIFALSPLGIGLVEFAPGGLNDRKLSWANKAMMALFGFTPDELEYLGQSSEVIYASREEFERVGELIREKLKKGELAEVDAKLKRRDGSTFDGYITMCFLDPSKPRNGLIATISDVTIRKHAEEQLRASLKEKELLLNEVHHRVKNNLQIVSSLLNLQSRRIKDKEILEIFKDMQSRVKSMALVHENLYQSRDITRINFAEYIRSLTRNLLNFYSEHCENIKLTIDAKGVCMDINTAIPCGLIINELTSNALKYAFPDNRKGELTISVHPLDGNEIELTVSDNGIGFPEAVDFRNTETLGMQLVTSLVEGQLDGIIKLDRSGGTAFKIKIRKQPPKS